ncbi:hypothetical protein QJQ45_007175 [Haematococcus lacustris]|nr:hypothetical protein QJQ45_007175 [Haematococcus lacustris]
MHDPLSHTLLQTSQLSLLHNKMSMGQMTTLGYLDNLDLDSSSSSGSLAGELCDDTEDDHSLTPSNPRQPDGPGSWASSSAWHKVGSKSPAAVSFTAAVSPRLAFLKKMPRAIGGYADELESGGAASPSSLSPSSGPQLTFLPTQDDSRTAARLGALHQLTHCQSVRLLRAKRPAAQPGASSSTSSDSVQGGGSSGGNMRVERAAQSFSLMHAGKGIAGQQSPTGPLQAGEGLGWVRGGGWAQAAEAPGEAAACSLGKAPGATPVQEASLSSMWLRPGTITPGTGQDAGAVVKTGGGAMAAVWTDEAAIALGGLPRKPALPMLRLPGGGSGRVMDGGLNAQGPWEGQAAGSARNRAGLPTAALTAARFRGSITQEGGSPTPSSPVSNFLSPLSPGGPCCPPPAPLTPRRASVASLNQLALQPSITSRGSTTTIGSPPPFKSSSSWVSSSGRLACGSPSTARPAGQFPPALMPATPLTADVTSGGSHRMGSNTPAVEVSASGSGQQEVVGERRQVIKAAFRGLVEAALPDLSPAQVDAVVAEAPPPLPPAQAPPPPPPAQAQPLPAAPGPVPRPQAPSWGRWLDRDTNACFNFQRIGESTQRPLELCSWKDREALPPVGKEYQQGYKRVNDRLPKVRQRLHRAAEYRRGIDGRARNNA